MLEIEGAARLAILVAGHKAELAFAAHELELSKMLSAHAVRPTRDHQQMRELLLSWPEEERLPVLVKGFHLADKKLETHADAVGRIAQALFAGRRSGADGKMRIEGDDLAKLLSDPTETADERLHHPRHRRVLPVLHLHPVLRPATAIRPVATL